MELWLLVVVAAVYGGSLLDTGVLAQRKTCPALTLANGRVRIRSQGRMAYFRCKKKFKRVGPKIAVCLSSGTWSQQSPVCVGRGCPDLGSLPDLTITELYRGGILEFQCAPGMRREGPQKLMCDGQKWDKEPPKCLYGISLGCDFEDNGLCGWSQDENDDFDWTWNSGSTPTSDTGPDGDHTTGSGHYIFMESSAPQKSGHVARLISPPYQPSRDMCMSFFYHMKGPVEPGEVGDLDVYVRTDKGGDQSLFHKESSQGADWIEGRFTIPPQTDIYRIVFAGTRRQSWTGDIGLDDIRVFNCSDLPSTTTSTTTMASKTTSKKVTTLPKTTMVKTTKMKTTQKLTTRKPTTQKTSTRRPTTPKRTTPRPTTPKRTTSRPTTPKRTTPRPTTPKRTTPRSTTPRPTTPRSTTPRPSTSTMKTTPKATPRVAVTTLAGESTSTAEAPPTTSLSVSTSTMETMTERTSPKVMVTSQSSDTVYKFSTPESLDLPTTQGTNPPPTVDSATPASLPPTVDSASQIPDQVTTTQAAAADRSISQPTSDSVTEDSSGEGSTGDYGGDDNGDASSDQGDDGKTDYSGTVNHKPSGDSSALDYLPLIVGVTLGLAVGMIVVAALAMMWARNRRKQKERQVEEDQMNIIGSIEGNPYAYASEH